MSIKEDIYYMTGADGNLYAVPKSKVKMFSDMQALKTKGRSKSENKSQHGSEQSRKLFKK